MYPAEPQSVSIGNSAFITCRVSGYPDPTITWSRHDRRPLSGRIIDDGQGSLSLTSVQLDDSGEYICTAQNPAGSVSATSQLNVQKSPEITRTPDVDELRLTVGDELRLECSATGVPAPSVRWLDNRQTQEADPYAVRSELVPQTRAVLTKYKVRQEDEGTYMCVASNGAGTDQRYVTLTVEPKRGDVGKFGFWS